MSKAAATWEHVGTLRPDPDNPVIHTPEEVAELRALIADTVWTEPIVCRREDRQIIAGHRRLAAALLAIEGDPAWKLIDAPKPGTVPVRFVDVTPEQARRLNLASNALAKQSAWDEEVLARILREMDASEIVGIGFDEDALAAIIQATPTLDTNLLDDETHIHGESEYMILRVSVKKKDGAELISATKEWHDPALDAPKGQADRLGALFLHLWRTHGK